MVGISIHTTLAGGDTTGDITSDSTTISIHTTLAGGDKVAAPVPFGEDLFQSTPPSRVATNNMPCAFMRFSISIHTTLAGGDSKNGREIHPFSIPIKA